MIHVRIAALGCATLLVLLLAGCATQEVEYVDERGNVLAVDEDGRPILPTEPSVTAAPVVAQPTPKAPRPVESPAKARRPAARPAAAPAKADGLGAPPAGALPASPVAGPTPVSTTPRTAPARAQPVAPQRPVDTSAGLDSPPAGS
ncbi:MAG: hypothetical protein QNJ98_17130 [Planctomycetota bacterium]|nr:hypothetical protein [Planctomycetota bacterium]